MNVLVVGNGAREHALAWKLRQSARLTDLFIAPGNAGTAALGSNLPVQTSDFAGLLDAVRVHRVELVVVGPEEPLANGLVDYLTEHGVAAYGPTRAASAIESSKSFAKEVMASAGVPTAAARSFDGLDAAMQYLDELEQQGAGPPVVKADGLAAGKGVAVCDDFATARAAVAAALQRQVFGHAGLRVLIEERMTGPEVSAHAFSDGVTAVPMVYSCDYKRIGDGDTGPNTGGMGAYSPPGFLTQADEERIRRDVIEPVIAELARRGRPFRGALYPGMMLTPCGPRVVEFNCRSGDPETQVLMPRLTTDLLEICLAVTRGALADISIGWSDRPAVGVVLASGGYPGDYQTGLPISGLDTLDTDVVAFHAGTRLSGDGRALTAGGRVLTVVAAGSTIAEARARAYENATRIRFDGVTFRTDIALREIATAPNSPRL